MDSRLADLDVLVMPTCPIVAPRFDEIAEPKAFMAKNAMLLRNTTIVNVFDCCAISLPLPREGGLPTGLMLVARNGQDRRLLRIAAAVESGNVGWHVTVCPVWSTNGVQLSSVLFWLLITVTVSLPRFRTNSRL